MVQNYLYKCTDCKTVQSEVHDYGISTWALSCKGCGVVTEHYQLMLGTVGNKIGILSKKEWIKDDTKEAE